MENKSNQYPYAESYAIALAVVDQLRPYCSRVEVAGSIRRKKPLVADIEIVAIPKRTSEGLFEEGLIRKVNEWKKVKGEIGNSKTRYTRRDLPEGIALDLFLATPENFGHIYAIRTGSAEFSHKVLACGWARAGYKSVDGYLTKGEQRFEVREESDLFDLIGIPYIRPEDRG